MTADALEKPVYRVRLRDLVHDGGERVVASHPARGLGSLAGSASSSAFDLADSFLCALALPLLLSTLLRFRSVDAHAAIASAISCARVSAWVGSRVGKATIAAAGW